MCWVVCWAHVLYGEVGAFCPLIQEEVSLGRFISFFCQCLSLSRGLWSACSQ